MKTKKKKKFLIKKKSKKIKDDRIIVNLKLIGKEAVELAILDYQAGDLAPTLFQQIGRVLWMLEKVIDKKGF